MQISKTRLAVRIVLVSLIVAVGFVAVRAWTIRRPSHYFDQAEAALAAGNEQAAKLNLQNLLQRYPRHGVAHLKLAQILLSEAQAVNPAVTYAHHPAAMQHLAAAGEALPDHAEVQSLLLENYLLTNRGNEAREAAERLHRLEPEHPIALIVLTRSALEGRRLREARGLLDALDATDHDRLFMALFLRCELARLAEEPAERAETVRRGVALAAARDPESWPDLRWDERVAARSVLALAVESAAEADEAHQLVEASLPFHEAFGDERGAVRLARQLAAQFPLGSLERGEQPRREALLRRIEAVVREAIEESESRIARQRQQADEAAEQEQPTAPAEHASGDRPRYPEPAVYQFLADRHFERGEADEGLTVLRAGLEASRDYPASYQRDIRRLKLRLASRLIMQGRFSEARPWIAPLLEDRETEGHAHMLGGSIALTEQRYHDALRHFTAAEKSLGPSINMQLALATSLVALDDWKTALPHLEQVVHRLNELNPEQLQWIARHLGDGNEIRKFYVRALLEAGRIDEAEPQARALIGTPQDPAVRVMLAAHHWRQGRYGRAITVLNKAHADYPGDLSILFALAITTKKQGYPMQAHRLIERFVEQRPQDLRRQMLQVKWDLWNGNATLALDRVQQLQQEYDAPLLPLVEAQIFLALGNTAEAAGLARRMLDHPDLQLSGVLLQAESAIQEHELEKMAHLLEGELALPDIEQSGQPGAVALVKARMKAAGGDPRAAIEAVVKILPYQPVAPRARVVLLQAFETLEQQEGTDEAERLLAELVERYPREAILLFLHANYAMQTGRHGLALQRIDTLQSIVPGTPVTQYLRGQSFAMRGDYDTAMRHLRAAGETDPRYLPAQLLAAQVLLAQRNYPQAAAAAARVLEINPTHAQAALIGADAFARQDRYVEAIGLVRNLLQQVPGHPEATLKLSELYLARNQPDLALQVIRVSRQTDRKRYDFAAREIQLLVRLNRVDEARRTADVFAAEQSSAEPAERYQLARRFAWLFLDTGQYDAARAWTRRMSEYSEPAQAPAVSWLYANIDIVQGEEESDFARLDSAVSHLRDVLAVAPDHVGTRNNLALLLAKYFHRENEALDLVDSIRREYSIEEFPPNLLDTMATVYAAAGRKRQARSLLSEGIHRHPLSADLHFQLGLLHAHLNEREPARERLITATRLGLRQSRLEEAQKLLNSLQQVPGIQPPTPHSSPEHLDESPDPAEESPAEQSPPPADPPPDGPSASEPEPVENVFSGDGSSEEVPWQESADDASEAEDPAQPDEPDSEIETAESPDEEAEADRDGDDAEQPEETDESEASAEEIDEP